MEIKLEVPPYDPAQGIQYHWEEGFEIKVTVENGTVMLLANREGLISLANHFLNLAQVTIPIGYHLHLDEHNSLATGSADIVIEKS